VKLVVYRGLVPQVLEGVTALGVLHDNGTPVAAAEERGGAGLSVQHASDPEFAELLQSLGLLVPELRRMAGPRPGEIRVPLGR
jgi:hypothetical protein